jgi:hypothetical protein
MTEATSGVARRLFRTTGIFRFFSPTSVRSTHRAAAQRFACALRRCHAVKLVALRNGKGRCMCTGPGLPARSATRGRAILFACGLPLRASVRRCPSSCLSTCPRRVWALCPEAQPWAPVWVPVAVRRSNRRTGSLSWQGATRPALAPVIVRPVRGATRGGGQGRRRALWRRPSRCSADRRRRWPSVTVQAARLRDVGGAALCGGDAGALRCSALRPSALFRDGLVPAGDCEARPGLAPGRSLRAAVLRLFIAFAVRVSAAARVRRATCDGAAGAGATL